MAVVFVHGAGMDHTLFEAQVDAVVGRGFRVVTWDLRGHGESTLVGRFGAGDAVEDLSALLRECGVGRAVVVGHSLGGNIGQAFVRGRAERVAGLVVVDSAWNAGPLTWGERVGLRVAAPLLALIPGKMLPGVMARASAVSPEVVARAARVFARMPKRVFLDVWRATVSFVEPEPGYRCPVPLALIRGERDRTGNIAAAMPRWARAEGVVEHVIPGAGHLVTWDAPEETTRVLLGILAQWELAC
ncbi:alpha/beta hydrolase [Nocardia sp. AG03]|uniref:alpha/beta fold hydrolase n=1 Tax=Nocardia sp. AG03 TaxID=3025312 RepID=UPI0024182FD5|nr:alpha/beta hydrolase [Nocardia sp. AG03]